MIMDCMRIGPEKVDAMVDYAFGHNLSVNGQALSLNGQSEPSSEAAHIVPRNETLGGSSSYVDEYEDELNGQAKGGVTDNTHDLNDNMEDPEMTCSTENSRSPVKTPIEHTSNHHPRLPSSLEASTGSGYFYDDDFSTQLGGNYATIDMDTFENEDISSFFAVYNNHAPENRMMLVRTRSEGALYNYELELSMSERTSSRGQSSSGYDCASSAELSFRSDQVYSPGMASLHSGPLFSSSQDGVVPQNLYSTDSLDRTDLDCSTEDDFNLKACYANKENYVLAFDRSPTKYSDDEQEYHDAWLSDATENLDGVHNDDEDAQTDSEYMCSEMDHSAGEMVYLDDYYSNEHEPLLAEHMLLSAEHEQILPEGAAGAAAEQNWSESAEEISEEFNSDDTQVVPEDYGYRSASDQDDSAINIQDGAPEEDSSIQDHLNESADNTMDDYDSQLLDEIEQELQMSADVSESFAYDNLTFEEDASLHASVEGAACGATGGEAACAEMEEFNLLNLKHMAASDSAQLISPDYEMMYSYPEGLSEVLAGRMNGGRLLKRWRNIQQNLHDLSSSEPITTTDPTDSIEPRAVLQPLGTVTLKRGPSDDVCKPMMCWGQTFGGKLEVPGRKEKEFHSSDSTLENISWTSRENSASELDTPSVSVSIAPKTLTTWQQVKKARTPQTSWKKIKEMKQFLRDEELLASSSSKCKSAPNLAQECESFSEQDDVASICYRPKREKQEDVENKRHSATLFEIFRRSKSEDQEYGKLPSPILQRLYGSLMAADGYFLNHLEESQVSFASDQRSIGTRPQSWLLENGIVSSMQHSRSSSINKINSTVATPGSSSNSCGSSPSSEANMVPPPYSHHALSSDAHHGLVLDDENLQAHNARTSGLMQHVSLLPIIQANFNCTESATRTTDHVMTTFASQNKPQSLKRDLAEMQQGDQSTVNNAYKHRLIDHILAESGGKFVDSITSFSGDTISKPVYTTSSPTLLCRGVQTSVTITQAGKVPQECQTSFDKTLCDEQFLSVEKSNSGQGTPDLQVGNSPTSQSLSSQYSQGSSGSKNRSPSSQRLDCADEIFNDDARSEKDKLSRSLMFMNTRLPDLSFLNPRGMSKSSTAHGEQHRRPQRSKSCDYSHSQSRRNDIKQRFVVKPKQKIVVIEDEQVASLTDAEGLAAEMQQGKATNVPASQNPRMILMNNEQFDNGSSIDSVSKGASSRKIEIVRNGEKAKFSNKMTNLEKDRLEKRKTYAEKRNRGNQDAPGYYANMSSTTSSAMDVSSDSQASHNNGVLNSPRMSRRDAQGHASHHNRCSTRSHDYHSHHCNSYDGHHGNMYGSHHGNNFDNHHGNHCSYHSFCHNCYMEQLHAMHHGSHCGWRHCSPHPDHRHRRNHSMSSPEGFVYYSDDDHHAGHTNRYNTHRAECLRRSSTDTDTSSRDSETSNTACDDTERPSDQSVENMVLCNESDTSSIEGRHLKPIIKQRKRRPLSAPSGINTHCQNQSSDQSSESTTLSEKSSVQGSDHEALSDDGAPTSWSADDHSVVRGSATPARKSSNTDNVDNRKQEDNSRRNYGVNLRNDHRHRHSYTPHCSVPYRQMHPCCMPPNYFYGCGHMMCCCHGNGFCCGDYNSRLRRNKKSVSFSEEIKYHSPYSSPHCSPKKQQKSPPLLQENGRAQAEERKERNRSVAKEKAKAGSVYPETHVSESSVDSAIGSESPPREFQISPTQRKTFDFDETLQCPEYRAKKDLVLEVGRAVEVIQSHYSQAMDSQERVHLGTSSDCPKVGSLLLSHMCPALYNLLGDGLKPRTHSLVGQIKNNLWKVIEESAEQCIAVSKVMIEIVKEVKSQIRLGSPLSKFNAFIFGLLNAKALDHWLTILQAQEKILHKHYNRDAFVILTLVPRGRYLFDEVVHLCKPLASLPFRVECSFEFKFRQLSPRREAVSGAQPLRRNSKLQRQRSLDDLEAEDAESDRWNGRLQLVQTSNSTLTCSDASSRDITSSEDMSARSTEPVLPELFQKTDVKQYIQQAREWIENGSKISDSAMDYLGQRFHREFGQFSQHPTENNRWSLPPIETVFSLANFFSKSSMQNESPSIEGFAMYLARISADAEQQGEVKAVKPQGSVEKMSPCEEVVLESDESTEDDLISFEDDSKDTLKGKLCEAGSGSSGSDVASISSEEIKVEQLIRDNEIVSPRLLELEDEDEKAKVGKHGNAAEWLIKFKEEDVTYKSTEYEFDGKLSIAMGGEDSIVSPAKSSDSSNASFDQHLEDMGIQLPVQMREPVKRTELRASKRLSCPLLRFTNESGRDEQHPKRWSLGASLINVFDKLLLDSPQRISPESSGTFGTPSGGHILDSPNVMSEITSSESESFRSALSCGDIGVPVCPVVPLKPVTAPPVVATEKSASPAVRPKELPLRRSTLLMPKSMTSSLKSDDSQKAQKRYVQAQCCHQAGDSEQLSFEKGDIMMTLKELDDDWFFCCHGNKTGLVSQSCVKEIEESEVLRRLNNSVQGE